MRSETSRLRPRILRATAGGAPAALAGSLAILMSATSAQAVEPPRATEHKAPRLLAGLDGSRASAPVSRPSPLRVVSSAVPSNYTVQPGDTVSTIASRHGLRTADVLALNGLGWSSVIYPGQVLILSAPTASPAETAPQAAAGSYVVRNGDTISAIAKAHGISIQAVFGANGLGWSSIIYPGQTIAIPGAAAPATPPAAPAPATPPAATAPSAGSYVVVGGDTISAIAQRHGVSTQAVLDANGLSRSSIIFPGQALAIPGAAATAPVATDMVPASATGLDAEQIGNAQIIISVGRELGVSDRGIAIALGTAMQESWLRNLDWGDRDSLGLFQQRPSTGWGTPEEVRDPARATRVFFGGASDPNGSRTRGLLDIAGWESLSFAQAAQAVQISAYPDRYAQWEQPAYAWLATYG